MLELKTKELDLKFNETVYKLKFPNVHQLKSFAATKESEQLAKFSELLVTLGMPQKVCDILEIDHIHALIKELTTVKK